MEPLIAAAVAATPSAAGIGVLITGLLLGIRHGIDWDHIAAITDITSTTAAAGAAEAAHAGQHLTVPGHVHDHGGTHEVRAHDAGPGGATLSPSLAARPPMGRTRFLEGQAEAIRLAPYDAPSFLQLAQLYERQGRDADRQRLRLLRCVDL